MWGFAKAALDLLEKCLQSVEAEATTPTPAAESQHFSAQEDRYGGVEVEVLPTAAHHGTLSFQRALKDSIKTWAAAGKQGLWLKVPLVCAHLLGAARDERFQFHHAKPDYVQLTRWLPEDVPSPLPLYAFTQIGVGGVVVNRAGQVLMVQERVSPLPMFQNRSASPVRLRRRRRRPWDGWEVGGGGWGWEGKLSGCGGVGGRCCKNTKKWV